MNPLSPARRLRELDRHELDEALEGEGLRVSVGPFDVRIQAPAATVGAALHTLYADYPLVPRDTVLHAHVKLESRWRLRPRPERTVRFLVDGRAPHEDMPANHALAVLEWGLNLVIAMRFHVHLMLHAAVLERGGRALVLPAAPGDGKTTLCAALAHRGWRLFSDEFGLVDPATGEMIPVPRPMPLKNESIAVLRSFAPEAVLGPVIPNTRKGTVSHVRPPGESVERAGERAVPAWVVFPRWEAGASLSFEPVGQAEAFMRLATNAFNYEMRGEEGFACLRQMVERTRCYDLVYSNLDEAIERVAKLATDE